MYTYILTSDTGFAPNPFHGVCTLCTCKPKIRKGAEPGDLIVGIASQQLGPYAGKLLYAMLVDEVIAIQDYGDGFEMKRPASWGQRIFYGR